MDGRILRLNLMHSRAGSSRKTPGVCGAFVRLVRRLWSNPWVLNILRNFRHNCCTFTNGRPIVVQLVACNETQSATVMHNECCDNCDQCATNLRSECCDEYMHGSVNHGNECNGRAPYDQHTSAIVTCDKEMNAETGTIGTCDLRNINECMVSTPTYDNCVGLANVHRLYPLGPTITDNLTNARSISPHKFYHSPIVHWPRRRKSASTTSPTNFMKRMSSFYPVRNAAYPTPLQRT